MAMAEGDQTARLEPDRGALAAVAAAPPLPGRGRSPLRSPLVLAAAALALLALGFLGGVLAERAARQGSSPATDRFPAFAGRSASFGGGFAAGGGLVSGEIAFVSGTKLTVTTAAGGSVEVEAPAWATVTKSVPGRASELRPGERVLVRGARNGSLLRAETIAVLPEGIAGGSAGAGQPPLFGDGQG